MIANPIINTPLNHPRRSRRVIFGVLILFISAHLGSAAPAISPATANHLKGIGFLIGLLAFVALVAVWKAALIAGVLLVQSIYPRLADRARERVGQRPFLLFMLGFANGLVGLVILAVLFEIGKALPIFSLFGLAAFVFLCLLALMGYTGLYRKIGEGVVAEKFHPVGATLAGGLAVETCAMLPLLGLLVQFASFCIALGVGTTLLLGRRRAKVNPDPGPSSQDEISRSADEKTIPPPDLKK